MDELQRLLEASPDAVLIVDVDGEVVRANQHVEAVLGYAPAALEGRSVEDLLDPEDREAHRRHRESYMADPEPRPMGQDLDLYARRDDGSRVPVEISLGPLEVDGEAHVVATITDVSERESRLEALQASEERYRRLLDISPAPIVIYDADGVIRYANEAVADLLGVADPEAVLGDRAVEYIHPDDRAATHEGMTRLIDDREPVEGFERRLLTADGEVRHAILSSAPITYEDEPAAQVLLSDVTEMKGRERELERQNERLDEFASIVSHDLRNPLNVLESSLELARETGDADHFDRAERAVDRMNGLVDTLLSIARQGQTPEETEAVALADVATAAWQTVDTQDADLEVDTDRHVAAEPSRLQALFENLFRNAVEHGSTSPRSQSPGDAVEHGSTSPHSPDRQDAGEYAAEHAAEGGTVTVRVEGREDGFAVLDDGVGIEATDSDEIFEPGYSTNDRGTGYGLAIVTEIAEAHGWTVDVAESEAGGAEFLIRTE